MANRTIFYFSNIYNFNVLYGRSVKLRHLEVYKLPQNFWKVKDLCRTTLKYNCIIEDHINLRVTKYHHIWKASIMLGKHILFR